ncbi:putative CoA-substrate-specific enzyme activase [Candidatus Desulfosporosinus infrequens]|uniref:Putative CoA-substrate-specific enzyme activase n=1 Tax=Candidatus Desulfosporosinus infrequens TaxID=2043169 RepID=A0A2U3LL86_9FIRM|nr:putative CoA-substrate-specific enzyme activase [Candidatus Desulfosporosinus infrequens]
MKQVGLDLGSVNTKLVVLENGEQVYSQVVPSRFDSVQAGITLLKGYSEEHGEKPEKLVVTGYGRVNFPEGRVITEITCQARGCHEYFPDYGYILDLGGQDAKVIKKNAQGKIVQFIMNDKCAAGTGRFLDIILKGLDLTAEELNLAAEAKPMPINSMCTVFAESEVITMLAKGIPKPEVVAGLFKSTAKRLTNFVESVGHPECLIFTGGGAHYSLLVRFLERELKGQVVIPPEPELTAAYGAALLA